MLDLNAAISRFGAEAKAKLANPGATGEPEDQLGAPLERLFADLAELCGFQREWLAAVGESSLSKVWHVCPTDWRAPFLPAATGDWARFPAFDELFGYNGSGVMPGRTWIIAPDADSLRLRWRKLVRAKSELKEELFHPHLRGGQVGD